MAKQTPLIFRFFFLHSDLRILMHIANPIYDVVFKYLLEDNKIAKLVIGAIIGEKVTKLALRPQEHTVQSKQTTFTIYRLDFSATIKTQKGEIKNVIIEIQKAKFPTDITRFRKYLAGEYDDPNNIQEVEVKDKDGKVKWIEKTGIPILSIYFLGYGLEYSKEPVIKVLRRYVSALTGEVIEQKEEFIESLTHDSIVIQIPYLKQKRQTELLTLLSIFDQSQQVRTKRHLLDLNEDDFPKKYHAVIRRLQRAIAEPEVQKTMDIEDDILEGFAMQERTIMNQYQELEESRQALEEKDKTIEKDKKVIEENEKTIETKDQAIEEKDRLLEEQLREIEQLKKQLKV